MKNIPIYIILVLFAVSCEIPFEIKEKSDPLIFVQCAPSNSDTTFFRVKYASPIIDGKKKTDFVPSVLSLKSDGKGLKVENKGELWFTEHKFKPGDEVSIRIEGADAKEAAGSVVMPPFPAIPAVELKKEGKEKNYSYRVKMTMNETIEREIYYGLQILQKAKIKVKEGEKEYEIEENSIISPAFFLSLADLQNLDMDKYCSVDFQKGVLSRSGASPMSLLTYRQFKKGVYEFYITDAGSSPFGELIEFEEEEPEYSHTMMERQIKLRLYRLSNEFYYYAKAQFLSNFDMLANMGLIPANFTYTNVKNGLGNIGGLSYVDTDWMSLKKEK